MYTTRFLDLPPLRRRRRHGAPAGLEEHLEPRAAARRPERRHDASSTTCSTPTTRGSCWTRCASSAAASSAPASDACASPASAARSPRARPTLFLGNAGTAMRPLTAALAVLAATQGGRFELRGVPRMHERPIGDLVDALRPLGCAIDYLGNDGFPPLRLGDGARHRAAPGAPIRVRGDVSSQFLTALLLALPLVARAATGRDRGRRRADLEALRRDHAEPARALRRRRRSATAGSASSIPAGSALPLAGRRSASRAMRRRRRTSSRSARSPPIAAPLRIDGVGRDSIQGDIALRRRGAARWAREVDGGDRLARGAARRAGRCAPIDARLQPHPRRRDDARRDGAVRRRHDAADQHRAAGASRRPTASPRWRPSCASSAPSVDEGADFIEVTPPATWRAAAIHTYDDHRIAMCFSLAAFNALAGAQPPLPVRILDPRCVGKTFPDYFETLFGVVDAHDRTRSRCITVDGPTASGKGTLASARRRGARLPPPRLRRAVPRDRAGGARSRRRAPTTSRRWRGSPAGSTCASSGEQHPPRRRRRRPTRCAARTSARWPRKISAWPQVRDALRDAAAVVPPPARAWWPTGATWAR